MHHLRQERNVRADYLIYLLQGAVDLDFRVSYYKIANGYERIPLSAADKERRKRAEEVPFDDALASVDLRLEENKVNESMIPYHISATLKAIFILTSSDAFMWPLTGSCPVFHNT